MILNTLLVKKTILWYIYIYIHRYRYRYRSYQSKNDQISTYQSPLAKFLHLPHKIIISPIAT